MKKIICLLIFIASSIANAQSFTVFDIDTTNFPTIKAKFFAFDADGKQITNLSPSDFEITENGTPRAVTNVSCPAPKPLEALSSVLVFDISGSMCGSGFDIAKAAGNVWVNMLPLGKSDCAITSFSDNNNINQDFTTQKSKLENAINKLNCMGGTNYNAALIDQAAGGILIAKTGKNKRVIIFLSDGGLNNEPRTTEIINQAKANNIAIYCVTIAMPAPQCMKDFSNQTGGLYFENIRTKEEAEECYRKILMIAQGGDPCTIEWQSSNVVCKSTNINVNIKCNPLNLTTTIKYKSPNKSIAKLEINPTSVKFLNPKIGVKVEQKITVTAINADYNVTNITGNNPSFYITPTSFVLNKGESRELTVSYVPADSGYNYCTFTFENNVCAANYYVSGGYKGKKPNVRTLKLIHPNGGEVFVAGNDTIITWEGIVPEEKVKIEYSTNNGTDWLIIAESATGLSYKWRVPKTPSNQCLARITANVTTSSYCDNPDVELCGKIWMGCNLDVETYRNGDPIPEVTDPDEWCKLTTGAWCYYNNDPAMGAIYGKLYNWYAVNDPRGLAPDGWHIPSDEEWKELEICLGMSQSEAEEIQWRGTDQGSQLAGRADLWGDGKLKSNSKFGLSGFSALPGGWRQSIGVFDYIGTNGYWWSSTVSTVTYAWHRYLSYYNTYIYRHYSYKGYGYSVRCRKD